MEYRGDLGRAVVKSTFVEFKTSPSPGLSSPSQDRVQRGSSLSQDRVQRGSSPSPSPNETVKTEKEKLSSSKPHRLFNY